MSSNVNQYYPTPPEAAIPLVQWLDGRGVNPLGNVIDPAAGRGALPMFLSPLGGNWHTYEIQGQFKPDLEALPSVASVTVGDSLSREWPEGTAIVANPPYGKILSRFVDKIHGHCRANKTLGAVLTRATWWGESRRGALYRPDVLLWIAGRISFTGDKNFDTSTHCWAVWLPTPSDSTEVIWLPKGVPEKAQTLAHLRMLGIDQHQLDMFDGGSA